MTTSGSIAANRSGIRRWLRLTSRGRRGRARASTFGVLGLLPLVLFLLIWQLVGSVGSPFFPPPSEWVQKTWPLFAGGDLLGAIGWTLGSYLAGLLLATAIGSLLGVAVGSSRALDRALGPTFEFLRAMPAASIVPVATLILGYTVTMKLTIVVLAACWPILLSVRSGRRSMRGALLDVGMTLKLRRRERVMKIVLPSLMGPILTGVKVASPVVLIITLLVEILTRINGLGGAMSDAQDLFKSAQIYGLLVVAGLLGFAVNWIVTVLERRVARRVGHVG